MLGEEIRKVRTEKGLKLKQLAKLLDVSFGFLGAVERGEKEAGKYLELSFEQYLRTGIGLHQQKEVKTDIKNAPLHPLLPELTTIFINVDDKGRETIMAVARMARDEHKCQIELKKSGAKSAEQKQQRKSSVKEPPKEL